LREGKNAEADGPPAQFQAGQPRQAVFQGNQTKKELLGILLKLYLILTK
jgi:hypothetical protein